MEHREAADVMFRTRFVGLRVQNGSGFRVWGLGFGV